MFTTFRLSWMKHLVFFVSVGLVGSLSSSGCGARSTLRDPAPEDPGPGPDPDPDPDPDPGPDPDPLPDPNAPCEPKAPPDAPDCSALDFDMQVLASCSIEVSPDTTLDGQGYLIETTPGKRVLAFDRWGKGHLIATCDATLAPLLWKYVDVEGYLGQTDLPRVASFGYDFPCDPGTGGVSGYDALPASVTYLGAALPDEYANSPELLAADWDVIIVCAWNAPVSISPWESALTSFVTEQGKGLMVLMDYYQSIGDTAFADANSLVAGAGLSFGEEIDLESDTLSVCSCVPDLP